MNRDTWIKLHALRDYYARRARRARILWTLAALVTLGTAAGLAWLVARAWGAW